MIALRFFAAAAFGVVSVMALQPVYAMSATDCSALYKSAKSAGTLNGMTWNDFRKVQCGATTTAAPATPKATATPTAKAATTATATPTVKAPDTKTAKAAADAAEPTMATTENAPEPAAPTMPAPKGVVFPKAVSSQYASQSAGKARMHTCLDQYNANKASNALGGLKWIQKGGGYYSMCNAKLKG